MLTYYSNSASYILIGWLVVACEQAELLKSYRLNKETRNLWALTAVGTLTGFIFTWATAMQI